MRSLKRPELRYTGKKNERNCHKWVSKRIGIKRLHRSILYIIIKIKNEYLEK